MVPAPIDRSNARHERRGGARRPRPANAPREEAVGLPIRHNQRQHFDLGVQQQPHEPGRRAEHPLRRRCIREPARRQLPRRGEPAPPGPVRSHRPRAELWAPRPPGGAVGCFAAGPPHQLCVFFSLFSRVALQRIDIDIMVLNCVRTDACAMQRMGNASSITPRRPIPLTSDWEISSEPGRLCRRSAWRADRLPLAAKPATWVKPQARTLVGRYMLGGKWADGPRSRSRGKFPRHRAV